MIPRIPAVVVGIFALMGASPLFAHDIPSDISVQAFVKPEGRRLRVLVRVPLAAMRDVNFPMRWPGLLDLGRADATLHEAAMLWVADGVRFYEGDHPLPPPALDAVRVSLPSDRSFGSWDTALAHVTGAPLPSDIELPWNQAMLDVLFEYPIESDRSTFSIDPAFARLASRVVTVLRFLPPGGAVRAFEYAGDPGLVRLDPRWYQAALQFVRLGFFHILSGTDHLLFLFCLVIPVRRIRALVLVVTAFTVAHSITLIASCYNLGPDGLWFPPLVETLIAISIVYMALENILFEKASLQRRWLIAFAFGLVHGFGFSFALRESLQFAGSHLLASLLSFNVGVELGQLAVLAVVVPALALVFQSGIPERLGTIVLSAFVAHTAWHWTLDRGARLREYRWPGLDMFVLSGLTRWLIAIVALAGAAWAVVAVLRHSLARRVEQKQST